MSDFTQGQIEWAARLFFEAEGGAPKAATEAFWKHPTTQEIGRRLLAELERQGVRACTESFTTEMLGASQGPWEGGAEPDALWAAMFFAAPICPEAE